MASDGAVGRCRKCLQEVRAEFDAHSFDCVPWFSEAPSYQGLMPGDAITVAVTDKSPWHRATVRTTHPAGALVDVEGAVITHGDPRLVVKDWAQYVTQKNRKGEDVWYR
ncbi:hypothetical protein ABZ714_13095 [Streptomyces sp. NPDC006798]|uniref:hypothetical protein n=1 Tax=Streptomyces sp. NPDC006798 TaxID=3155462 RepID=UPI0033CBA578